jgi:hypothetical protein
MKIGPLSKVFSLTLATFAQSCRSSHEAGRDEKQRSDAVHASSSAVSSARAPTSSVVRPAPSQAWTSGPEWTAGIAQSKARVTAASTLRDLRAGRHDGFDRLVFEFDGGLPNYHIEYIDKPVRQCGSGEATPIVGDAWLSVAFEPAYAHSPRTRIPRAVRRPSSAESSCSHYPSQKSSSSRVTSKRT